MSGIKASVCHMNKKFNQTAGQVAHKSYQSCVVRATDIVMKADNNSHKFNLFTGQVTKNVASPPQNEPVIGLGGQATFDTLQGMGDSLLVNL